MARGGPLALVASTGVLIWAHFGVASLAVCLNESPDLARDLAAALPWSSGFAAWLLPLFAPLGGAAGSPPTCDPAAHARALGVAGVAYVVGVFVLRHGGIPSRIAWPVVVIAGTLMRLAMFFMPALLSSDIIDYATHGRVAALHAANPYEMTPSQFAGDPFSSLGAWPKVVTVYGPLWTHVDALVTGLLPQATLVQLVFAYKLIALVADLVSLVLLVWLAMRWRHLGATRVTPLVAVTMWLWNPLVNVELIGNAHNESVMIALVLGGLALLTLAVERQPSNRWLWLAALVTVWLGALVKFVPAAIEAVVALVWLRGAERIAQRVVRLALLLVVLAAISVVVAVPWLDSPAVAAPVLGLASGGQRFKDVWQDAPAAWLTVRVVPLLGVPDDPATLRMDVARLMVWSVTRALFVVYVLVEAWQLWRDTLDLRTARAPSAPLARGDVASAFAGQVLRRVGLACMRVLLLSLLLYTSQVYAWYFLWPLPFACLLGPRNGSSRAVLVFGLTFLPAFYLREFQSFGVFEMPLYAELSLAILAATWLVSRGAAQPRAEPARATRPAPEPTEAVRP